MSSIYMASFDGGGARGLIPAVALSYIEKALGKPFLPHTHLSAGTSTGAIIMSALSTPKGYDKPLYSAQDIINRYYNPNQQNKVKTSLEKIFKRANENFWQKSQYARLFSIPFTNQSKEDELKDILNTPYHKEHDRDLWLSDMKDYMLITTFNVDSGESHILNTYTANKTPSKNYRLYEGVNASTAAPGFFDLPLVTNKAGQEFVLGDGGFVAHNPLNVVFNEAVHNWGLNHKYTIASFGTGKNLLPANQAHKKMQNMNMMQWAKRAPNAFMRVQSSYALKQSELYKQNVDLIRFDIDFKSTPKHKRPSADMSNVDPKNIEKIYEAAHTMMKSDDAQRKVERLVKAFSKSKTPIEELEYRHLSKFVQLKDAFKKLIKGTNDNTTPPDIGAHLE